MDEQKFNLIQDIRKRRQLNKRRRAKKRAAVISVIAAASVVSSCFVYTASANEITLTEIDEFNGSHETTVIKTHTKSVEKILADNGVSVGESDKLNVPIASDVTDDANIVVKRGRQITVKTKDGEQVVSVTKADAKEALAEAGIAVGEMDEVTSQDGRIELVEVNEKEETTTEAVPFETEYVEDSTLPAGETKVKTEGSEGVKTIVHKVTLKDGSEVDRQVVSEDITEAPVNKVVLKGTKPGNTVATASAAPAASESGNTIAGYKYTKKITMRATAYSTHPSENGGYTVSALGNQLGHGIVAVDPSVVPLGSKVYVAAADGSWVYGVASAEDTGGSIKGNKIDLCYEGTVAEVNQFGIRDCVVYVLE